MTITSEARFDPRKPFAQNQVIEFLDIERVLENIHSNARVKCILGEMVVDVVDLWDVEEYLCPVGFAERNLENFVPARCAKHTTHCVAMHILEESSLSLIERYVQSNR